MALKSWRTLQRLIDRKMHMVTNRAVSSVFGGPMYILYYIYSKVCVDIRRPVLAVVDFDVCVREKVKPLRHKIMTPKKKY